MAKQRIRLRGTRTQSKVAQKKLMEKLKALYEDPLILLPNVSMKENHVHMNN